MVIHRNCLLQTSYPLGIFLIISQGLVLSEMPLGTRPVARDFPRRNRIISGLSLGTLVVEAALQSGSLITARLAGEQGREVMALPGSPLDPRAHGTNRLLRDGAHLVENAEDILNILKSSSLRPTSVRDVEIIDLFAREDEAEQTTGPEASDAGGNADPDTLEDLLSFTPVSVDELARQSGQPLGLVQAELLELELAGRIVITSAGLVAKTDAH